MIIDLLESNKKARMLMMQGRMREALLIWTQIVQEQPDWEGGSAYYEMAVCEEELGLYEEAREHFLGALRQQPEYEYFIRGYASFLYMHGDVAEALAQHLKLIHMMITLNRQSEAERITVAAKELARRLNTPQAEIEALVAETRRS